MATKEETMRILSDGIEEYIEFFMRSMKFITAISENESEETTQMMQSMIRMMRGSKNMWLSQKEKELEVNKLGGKEE